MKKFLAFLLVSVMLLGCVSIASAATEFDPELVKGRRLKAN